jgi:hypothetical protein
MPSVRQVEIECFVDPTSFDVEAFAAGVEELARRVPEPDAIRVIVTENFESTVRERTDDPALASSYQQERVYGFVAAKVVGRADGSTELVVDASGFRQGDQSDAVAARRLFAHEGLHIALAARDEATHGLRARRGLERGSAAGMFTGIAGGVCEEYRVERALCDEGFWPVQAYRTDLPDAVRAYRDSVLDGLTLRYPGESIERCASAVLQGFEHMATLAAYLAAEQLASNGARPLSLPGGTLERYFASSFDDVCATLAEIPSAETVIPRETLDLHADRVRDACDQWFERMGFALQDLDDSNLYFDVLEDSFDAY